MHIPVTYLKIPYKGILILSGHFGGGGDAMDGKGDVRVMRYTYLNKDNNTVFRYCLIFWHNQLTFPGSAVVILLGSGLLWIKVRE